MNEAGSAGGWPDGTPGVLELPSGRRVRGRALSAPAEPPPDLGVYLTSRRVDVRWLNLWVPWVDFGLPSDPDVLAAALAEALSRADSIRVEFACGGGLGRTGTALACLAVLDGVPARDAVSFVRDGYDARAVETPWQRRFVRRFGDAEQ